MSCNAVFVSRPVFEIARSLSLSSLSLIISFSVVFALSQPLFACSNTAFLLLLFQQGPLLVLVVQVKEAAARGQRPPPGIYAAKLSPKVYMARTKKRAVKKQKEIPASREKKRRLIQRQRVLSLDGEWEKEEQKKGGMGTGRDFSPLCWPLEGHGKRVPSRKGAIA